MRKRHNRTIIPLHHPLYDGDRCLTPKDMLIRAQNGLPLNLPVQQDSKLPINNKKFFQDSFDVIDVANRDLEAIRKKIDASKEKRQAEQKKQYEAFLNWQKEQDLIKEVKSNIRDDSNDDKGGN